MSKELFRFSRINLTPGDFKLLNTLKLSFGTSSPGRLIEAFSHWVIRKIKKGQVVYSQSRDIRVTYILRVYCPNLDHKLRRASSVNQLYDIEVAMLGKSSYSSEQTRELVSRV